MVTKQGMLSDMHDIVDQVELDTEPLLGFALVLIRKDGHDLHFDITPGCEYEVSDALMDASGEVMEEEDDEEQTS